MSFFGARTPAAGGPIQMVSVSSPMGKRSWKKRPSRLWPCEKALLAGFEPRNASRRTPSGFLRARASVIPGVTVGRDRHSEARSSVQALGTAVPGYRAESLRHYRTLPERRALGVTAGETA